jgi:hypothetical protein
MHCVIGMGIRDYFLFFYFNFFDVAHHWLASQEGFSIKIGT